MLLTLGIYRLWRHRHPRFGGMQVGFGTLDGVVVSDGVRSRSGIHGAAIRDGTPGAVSASTDEHAGHLDAAAASAPWTDALAVGVHTLAYLLVMSLVAWLVYWKLGLRLLRTAWFNLDWLWAGALVVTGVVVLLM